MIPKLNGKLITGSLHRLWWNSWKDTWKNLGEESRDTSLFVVGDRFSSCKELEEQIKIYEEVNFIQLGHQVSRTLEGVKKRTPKRVENANKDLKYYSLCLSCNYGGKKHH